MMSAGHEKKIFMPQESVIREVNRLRREGVERDAAISRVVELYGHDAGDYCNVSELSEGDMMMLAALQGMVRLEQS